MSFRKLRDLSYYFSVVFKSYFVPHHIHAKFYSQANWFRIYDGEAEEGLLIFPICLMSKKPRLVSFNTQTYIEQHYSRTSVEIPLVENITTFCIARFKPNKPNLCRKSLIKDTEY